MSHVGVQRFGARNRKHHSAEHEEPVQAVVNKKSDGVVRTERAEDLWLARDLHETENADREEPDQRHGSEQHANTRRSETLHGKEADENRKCYQDDEALE